MGAVDLHAGEARRLGRLRRHAEMLNEVGDLRLGQGDRIAELLAGEGDGGGRRRLGVRIDRDRRLAPGVADLHPDMPAAALARRGHAGEGGQCLCVRRAIDDHIAGTLQMKAVDLHIAGDQEAGSPVRPEAVEPLQFRRRTALHVRQPLRHRGLGEAVRQHGPARQDERIGQAGHRLRPHILPPLYQGVVGTFSLVPAASFSNSPPR